MTGHKTKLERLALNQDWVPVAAALSDLANFWASRRDLSVYLGRDGGERAGAAAFYDPGRGDIEINSVAAFGTDSANSVGNLLDRMELSKRPVAGGLTLHESMHARYSRSDLEKMQKRFDKQSAFTVYSLLEETRIEGRAVILWKSDSTYLRASCKALLMCEPDEFSGRFAMVALVGRAEVGVLEESDVDKLVTALEDVGFTGPIQDTVRDRVHEFLYLDDDVQSDLDRMVEIAIELDELMPQPPSDGEGEGGIGDAISDALDAAERGGQVAVVKEAQSARDREARAEKAEASRTEEENQRKADSIFMESDERIVPLELRGSRAPSTSERSAAVILSKALEHARYRAPVVTDFDSPVPAGRFNGTEAMRLKAARVMGTPTEGYKPFRKQDRKVIENPPLTVGIMSDTSGSMSSVQPAVGVATWVISDAVYRLGKAVAASVYFGTEVKPGLYKGERQKEIHTYKGGGGYEDFDGGFRALDGALNLLHGKGARLLVVVSDGQFKTYATINQVEARERWLNTCIRNGVAVLWLQLDGRGDVQERPGVRVLDVTDDIQESARKIGSACIEVLGRVSGS